jgi:hypothetical protein
MSVPANEGCAANERLIPLIEMQIGNENLRLKGLIIERPQMQLRQPLSQRGRRISRQHLLAILRRSRFAR